VGDPEAQFQGVLLEPRQNELFQASAHDERDWLLYCAWYKALANFLSSSSDPFALRLGKGSKELHLIWGRKRAGRTGYADPAHPFCHQGSADINTYKLFLELAHALLRPGGRFGLIVPSGLYTDKGTTEMRTQLLVRSRWRWLFGFENRDKIFDIDSRFKFCPVIVEKAGETEAVHAAFMRRDVNDWAVAERIARPLTTEQLRQYSGDVLTFPEIRHEGDVEFLDHVYSLSVKFGPYLDNQFGRRVLREVDKTNDSSLFLKRTEVDRLKTEAPYPDFRDPRTKAWLFQQDLHLIVEGKCIGMFDNVWAEPTILMTEEAVQTWYARKGERQPDLDVASFGRARIVFREIARSTDRRSMIATMLPPGSLTTYTLRAVDLPRFSYWWIVGVLNSLVFDLVTRLRGNLHLSTCYDLLPIPHLSDAHSHEVETRVKALLGPVLGPAVVPFELWAEHVAERSLARAEIDALIASALGLEPDLFESILGLDENVPIGFWRVDRDVPPERRQPTLAIKACRVLAQEGIGPFSAKFREAVGAAESPSAGLAWAPFGAFRRAWEEALSAAPELGTSLREAGEIAYGARKVPVRKVAEGQGTPYVEGGASSGGQADLFNTDTDHRPGPT
jgi:hypothetical protein